MDQNTETTQANILDYSFVISAFLTMFFELIIYSIVAFKVPLRQSPFIFTLLLLFTINSITGLAYMLLYSIYPNDDAQITLWSICFMCYTLGHYLFSYQYWTSAIEVDIFIKSG